MDMTPYLFMSFSMFLIGILGLLFKRNVLIFFLSIELMLNSANLLFVAFSRSSGNETGLIWVFFVLVVAAAEAAVGLSIVIHSFRTKQIVDIDGYSDLRD